MDLTKTIENCRKLARKTTWWCAVFEILNTLFIRLHWKSHWGIPVSFHRQRNIPFYMRLGTTDWDTFTVTFLLDEYGFVCKHLPKLRTIVDLGANIGDSVRYFADAYDEGKILAIEPDADNYKMCKKNVERINTSDRIRCKQCFVGARSGYSGIDRSKGEWSYTMNRTATAEERIPVVTISDLMQEFGFNEIDLLKCDIEGAEAELFHECSGWIFQIHHLAIETCPPYSVALLENELAASGTHFVKLYHEVPDGFHELALFRRVGSVTLPH
jgi:FkbM family methyltransferase